MICKLIHYYLNNKQIETNNNEVHKSKNEVLNGSNSLQRTFAKSRMQKYELLQKADFIGTILARLSSSLSLNFFGDIIVMSNHQNLSNPKPLCLNFQGQSQPQQQSNLNQIHTNPLQFVRNPSNQSTHIQPVNMIPNGASSVNSINLFRTNSLVLNDSNNNDLVRIWKWI